MATKNDTLKNRDRYSSTFDKDLLARLKEVSNKTSIPMSKLFDIAIQKVLEIYE